jgi:hypothetical protein
MSTPILSHNSSTNNILLQITVPKRTGRKRKRGSQDPYSSDPGSSTVTEQDGPEPLTETVRSHSRNDNPLELLRTLKDNVGKYKVEAVAEIDRTHRFRGMVHHVIYERKLIRSRSRGFPSVYFQHRVCSKVQRTGLSWRKLVI